MKQLTLKVERGSRGFGLSLVYRGLDHFDQVGWWLRLDNDGNDDDGDDDVGDGLSLVYRGLDHFAQVGWWLAGG